MPLTMASQYYTVSSKTPESCKSPGLSVEISSEAFFPPKIVYIGSEEISNSQTSQILP